MAFTVTKDTATPIRTDRPDGDTERPITADDYLRSRLTGLAERLDQDHEFAEDATTKFDDSTRIGYHTQVTIYAPQATPSTPDGSKGIVYTKDFDSKAELCYIDADTDTEVQITSAGNLLLTAAAVEAAKANILDETTIESNSGVIRLKDGDTGDVGIRWEHLSTDAAAFCDDDTLEIDNTNGLQVKTPATPSTGSDAYADACGIPVIAWGSYTGAGSNLDIDAGITIKHLVIINTTDNGPSAAEAIVTTDGTHYWAQDDGENQSGLAISGQTFTVTDGNSEVNANNKKYYWFAEGIRI